MINTGQIKSLKSWHEEERERMVMVGHKQGKLFSHPCLSFRESTCPKKNEGSLQSCCVDSFLKNLS